MGVAVSYERGTSVVVTLEALSPDASAASVSVYVVSQAIWMLYSYTSILGDI